MSNPNLRKLNKEDFARFGLAWIDKIIAPFNALVDAVASLTSASKPDYVTFDTNVAGDGVFDVLPGDPSTESYTKIEADARFEPIDSAYTKAEADARYEPIDSAYTKAEADGRFEPLDSAYTKVESDARYEPLDSAYTKAESDARYEPIDSAYTKAEADSLLSAKVDDSEFSDHISGAAFKHNASSVTVVATGGITSTNVQSALEELQGEVSALSSSGITEATGDARYVQQSGDTMTGLLNIEPPSSPTVTTMLDLVGNSTHNRAGLAIWPYGKTLGLPQSYLSASSTGLSLRNDYATGGSAADVDITSQNGNVSITSLVGEATLRGETTTSIVSDTGLIDFKTSGVSRMSVSAAGTVSIPNLTVTSSSNLGLAVARCRADTSTTIATATNTRINYGYVIYDSHSAVTTGAGAWKFTCPSSGYFQISAQYNWAALAPTDCIMFAIRANSAGATIESIRIDRKNLGASEQLSGSHTFVCNSAEQIWIEVWQNSGANRTNELTTSHVSIVQIARLASV